MGDISFLSHEEFRQAVCSPPSLLHRRLGLRTSKVYRCPRLKLPQEMWHHLLLHLCLVHFRRHHLSSAAFFLGACWLLLWSASSLGGSRKCPVWLCSPGPNGCCAHSGRTHWGPIL